MRRFWALITFLIIVMITSACNLGRVAETEEPLVTPTEEDAAGQPEVSIISPQAGDEFVVDEEILVSVNAVDAVGVTRLQLFANGQIVKTVSSEAVEGDTTLNAVLDYIPSTAGTVNMRVLAFRGAVSSEPADLQLTVRSNQAQVTATSNPGPGVPQIPNDNVCRALVNVGLNFRSQPTTSDDNIITVLPGGTLAPITGRLGDNTWWRLSVSGATGWVSAEYTTVYGNCFSVPVITVNPPTPTPTLTSAPTLTSPATATSAPGVTVTPGRPDLIVTDIAGDRDLRILIGGSEVRELYSVTITNNGTGPARAFEVVMDFDGTEIDLGAVSDLDPGQSIVLTVSLTFDELRDYDLQVEVDPLDVVDEVSEINNRGEITVNVSMFILPLTLVSP